MKRYPLFLLFFLWFAVSYAAGDTASECFYPQIRTGKDYALFFAVDQYDSLRSLKNPVKDAYSIAKELSDHYGFKTEVVENPTLKEIELKLKDYQKDFASGRYAEDGQLLVLFSGHGMIENKNGFFLAKDSDPKELHRTALAYEYWRPFINSIDCKHIMVALDACFSGTFDPGWWDRADRFGRPGELGESEKLIEIHKKYKTRMFFSSATEEESPDDSNFAKKFLAGLRSWGGKDAVLTSTELYSHLELASPKPHFGDFGDYEPGSSFLFIIENPLEDNGIDQAGTDALEKELIAWKVARSVHSVTAYQAYLKQYPNGEFRPTAINWIKELQKATAMRREEIDWEIAREKNTEEDYLKYQQDYPEGVYYKDANAKIQALVKPEVVVVPESMVLVNGGTFEMGDLFGDGGEDEKPIHQVTVSSFYLSIYELTYAEFDAYLDSTGRGKLPKILPGLSSRPINNVNWYEAIEYCNWRSREEGLTEVYQIDRRTRDRNNNSNSKSDQKWSVTANWSANGYRLPTEAEWEYAARSGGIIEKYAGTSDVGSLNAYANFSHERNPSAVGSLRPNRLGLHDMGGNVREWCWDWYGAYGPIKKILYNPRGPESGNGRINRGGSFEDDLDLARVANRSAHSPDRHSYGTGFRLARSIK